MAHSRKQQGQYRKIIKDDNPDFSVPLVPSSIVPLFLPSSSIPSLVPSVSLVPSSSTPSLPFSSSSTSTSSSSPVIPMPDDKFKEFINKLCGSMYENMYKHMYNQLFNDIKSVALALFQKTESTKNTKLKI